MVSVSKEALPTTAISFCVVSVRCAVSGHQPTTGYEFVIKIEMAVYERGVRTSVHRNRPTADTPSRQTPLAIWGHSIQAIRSGICWILLKGHFSHSISLRNYGAKRWQSTLHNFTSLSLRTSIYFQSSTLLCFILITSLNQLSVYHLYLFFSCG